MSSRLFMVGIDYLQYVSLGPALFPGGASLTASACLAITVPWDSRPTHMIAGPSSFFLHFPSTIFWCMIFSLPLGFLSALKYVMCTFFPRAMKLDLLLQLQYGIPATRTRRMLRFLCILIVLFSVLLLKPENGTIIVGGTPHRPALSWPFPLPTPEPPFQVAPTIQLWGASHSPL